MHKRSILSISDWTSPVLVTCSSDVDTVSGVCTLRGSVSTVPPWVWDRAASCQPKCFQPRFRAETSATPPHHSGNIVRVESVYLKSLIYSFVPRRKGVDFSAFWKISRSTRDEVGCSSWNNSDRFVFVFFFFFFVQKKEVGRSLIYTELRVNELENEGIRMELFRKLEKGNFFKKCSIVLMMIIHVWQKYLEAGIKILNYQNFKLLFKSFLIIKLS